MEVVEEDEVIEDDTGGLHHRILRSFVQHWMRRDFVTVGIVSGQGAGHG